MLCAKMNRENCDHTYSLRCLSWEASWLLALYAAIQFWCRHADFYDVAMWTKTIPIDLGDLLWENLLQNYIKYSWLLLPQMILASYNIFALPKSCRPSRLESKSPSSSSRIHVLWCSTHLAVCMNTPK